MASRSDSTKNHVWRVCIDYNTQPAFHSNQHPPQVLIYTRPPHSLFWKLETVSGLLCTHRVLWGGGGSAVLPCDPIGFTLAESIRDCACACKILQAHPEIPRLNGGRWGRRANHLSSETQPFCSVIGVVSVACT